MKSSIRKFLLIYLLLAIAVTTTLSAIGNYYLGQNDIQEHMDTLMAVSALSYQALLGDDIHNRSLPDIQESLSAIPQKIDSYYQHSLFRTIRPDHSLNRFNFQIWSDGGTLLLHSASALTTPMASDTDGFTNREIENQKWRTFTTYNEKAKIRTVLAEHYHTVNDLGHRIAQDHLYIMLLTFPLSGLLIWIIIGRGLVSLDRIAQELSSRAPSHLDPVNIEEVPEEIKPVIDELNKLFYRLKQGFEREKRFAADAAHELRTPLAALKAQAQVALNTNDIQEKNKALEKLIASVNRSTHVVQQLLTLNKLLPEAITPVEHELVYLPKITREVLAILAPTAIEKQIELEFQPQEPIHPFAGNPTAISILIQNLVDNAIRYSTGDGQIIVRAYSEQAEVVFEVQDNGPGIPPELHERVFERFFRVLGNKTQGSGLGLAIVQQICESHHGRITIDSPKEGTGLIVKVYFPIHQTR